jgi:tetratricopeptide (TPR) repeat protein
MVSETQPNEKKLIKLTRGLSFAHQLSPSFYSETYHTLQPQDIIYQKVRIMFDRVIQASGIEKHRNYQLIIFDHSTLEALSFPDGSVVISTGVIDLCYADVRKNRGDGRLAFILGHELAHLSRNDFWHVAAFNALEKHVSENNTVIKKTVQQLIKSHNPLGKEYRADASGFRYASMAGYDTKSVVNQYSSDNLFEKWFSNVSSITQNAETTHPYPVLRAAYLLTNIQTIVDALDIFSWGVRLFQVGKYDDATSFFHYFSNNYPSREVLNNLGLSYLKKAIQDQYACRDHQMLFQLSTLLDPKTRASAVRGCDDFQKNIQNAISFLQEACKRDLGYLPSKINLAAAKILCEDYHGAISTLKALENNPSVENNRAISQYLMGKQMNIDLFDTSQKVFSELIEQYPHYTPAYYNLGRLYIERGELSIAETNWLTYLKYSPYGIYADSIRNTIQVSEDLNDQKIKTQMMDTPLIQLGELTADKEKELEVFEKKEFEINYMPVMMYSYKGYRLLVLDWEVVCVESPAGNQISVDQLFEVYGQPVTVFEDDHLKTMVYHNFSVDVCDGTVQKMIHF